MHIWCNSTIQFLYFWITFLYRQAKELLGAAMKEGPYITYFAQKKMHLQPPGRQEEKTHQKPQGTATSLCSTYWARQTNDLSQRTAASYASMKQKPDQGPGSPVKQCTHSKEVKSKCWWGAVVRRVFCGSTSRTAVKTNTKSWDETSLNVA